MSIECEGVMNEDLGIRGFIDLLESAIIPESALVLPHKVKNWLSMAGYNISQDDFSMLTFEKTSGNNSFTFELSQLTGGKKSSSSKYEKNDYKLDSVSLASTIIERLCFEKTWSERTAAEAELVASEFVTNIISHGLESNRLPIVIIQLNFDDSGVTLRFIDNGIEWKPSILKSNLDDFFDRFDKFSESGRGMAIIKSISDSIKRQRYDGINETTIYLKRDE